MRTKVGGRTPAEAGLRGFTLIEIVVSLTVIAVITAIAIPTLKGLERDQKAREPIQALAEVVQECRHRAMHDRQSYQIVFEHEGIHASTAMYPYEKRDEFLKQLEELRTPPKPNPIERVVAQRAEIQRQEIGNRPLSETESGSPGEPPAIEPPWTVTIPLTQGTECEVLMWGDGDWDVIEGQKMRRWVFQHTGMVNPARVRLRTGSEELEAGFDPLTGELTRERTRLTSMQR